MSAENWKLEKDLCRCCHNEGSFKKLDEPCKVSGLSEAYTDMLRDCFDIDIAPALGVIRTVTYKICDTCIMRLNNASDFKKQVQRCEDRFRNMYSKIVITVAKPPVEIYVKQENSQTYQEVNTQTWKDDIDNFDKSESDVLVKMEFECNEESDVFNDDDSVVADDQVNGNDNSSIKAEVVVVEESDVFKDSGMTESLRTKLLLRNKLKRKILTRKSKTRKLIDTDRDPEDKRKINSIKLRQNAGLIIEHSTILPFKFNKGYFECHYCNTRLVNYNDLKSHVNGSHENNSFKTIIKGITRPKEPTKADVSDINCRICKKHIDKLESLIKHLTDEHNVKFNFDVNMKPNDCILPFDLSDGTNKCYYCKAEFLFFNTLSEHMNEHSTKYVCEICGRCFILPQRLRSHLPTHNVEESVKCDVCGKVFNSKILLKGHMRFKHLKNNYKCTICNETFPDRKSRILHLEEVHNRAPLDLTCKICSRTFGALNSYNSHVRSEHTHRHLQRERKHVCGVCGKTFKMRKGLKNHLVVHSDEKKYECEVCHKKYGRVDTMREHLKIHRNDKRWSCGVCSQAFVQKNSLRNHIRVHHPDMDLEQLIVHKKQNDAK